MRRIAMIRFAAILVASTLVAGCATVSSTPRVATGAAAPPLQGHLDFDGAREHLPASLTALPPAGPESTTVLRYRYQVRSDDTDLSILMLLNPLTLLGCPTGSASVTADASLDVVSNGSTVKRYAAHSVASRLRTIYGGDPLSELRRLALRASADSIAGQLAADPPPLTGLAEATPGDPPANDNGGDR